MNSRYPTKDWKRERYVKLYIHDSINWIKAGWEGQTLYCLLLRKTNKVGCVGGSFNAEDVSLILCIPIEIAEVGLRRLVKNNLVFINEKGITFVNFDSMQFQKIRNRNRSVYPITRRKRFEIFKRDQFTCQYCGDKSPDVHIEVDHIIPVSKGGSNENSNLVTACFDCNRGKSNRGLIDGENDD